ncbi:hypothetical protein COBT_001508 [Conglomerata obtusa]
MTTENISDIYPLASLFINSCGKEVTIENMESLFKSMKVDFLPKLGKSFCMSSSKLEEYTSFVGNAPKTVAVAATQVEEVVQEEAKKEEKVDLDFDDLFC